MNPNKDYAQFVDFPVNIGSILEETARKSGRLLNAASQQEVSWNGTRAYIVGQNTPSFRQKYGDEVKSTDKGVAHFDMYTMSTTICFRLAVEQEAAMQENGTLNEFLAKKFLEGVKGVNQLVEYGIIHGYDIISKVVLDAYNHKHGSIAKAVASTNKYVAKGADGINPALVDASIELGEFDTTDIFVTPKAYAESYKYYDENKVVLLSKPNVMGVDLTKLREVSSLAVPNVIDNEAIVGDFSRIVWGLKAIDSGLSRVIAGDPDGNGDLARRREVAYMADVAYAWGITHPEAFAIIKADGTGAGEVDPDTEG